MKPSIVLKEYPQPWIQSAVELIVEHGNKAIQHHGRFSLALSGGSTPKAVFEALAEPSQAERMNWDKTDIFWGDERCVPPDDTESNYRMARLALLDKVKLPAENIHRIHGELPPEQAADDYQAQLKAYFHGDDPHFDLVLLGLGPDGHTASLFPGSAGLAETQRWVIANFAPGLGVWRVSLTYPVLFQARQIVFLVAGEKKAQIVHNVLDDPDAASQYPAARLLNKDVPVTWLLDNAAAKLL